MRAVLGVAAVLAAVAQGRFLRPSIDEARALGIWGNTHKEHVLSSKYQPTPLDTYVTAPDPAFQWEVIPTWTKKGDGWSAVLLNVTSQTWLNSSAWHYSDGSPGGQWWHHVLVVVPDQLIRADLGFLWIGEDDNSPSQTPSDDDLDLLVTTTIATRTGSIAAACYFVPNQPLMFTSEANPQSRSEDEVIAWGWYEYMVQGGVVEWVMRLPMTKAAFAAMDAVEAYSQGAHFQTTFAKALAHASQERELSELKAGVSQWIVGGASKRGWTTWTTAAVDANLASPRLIAFIPIVMDLFDLNPSLHHHYRSLGGWTFAFEPYYESPVNLTARLDSPGMSKLAAVSDPLTYIERFGAVPKLVIDACGDEFFLPDDDMFFWDFLPGEKYRLMLPNAEHSLATAEQQAIDGASAFVLSVIHGLPRPRFTWAFSGQRPDGAPPKTPGQWYGEGSASGNISLTVDQSFAPYAELPTNVTAWFAYSAEGTGRRDFRLVAGYPNPGPQLVLWLPVDVTNDNTPGSPNFWNIPPPDAINGQWAGMILDLRFALNATASSSRLVKDLVARVSASGLELDFTSSVSITPATYPFADCHGAGCQGHLL